MDKPYPIPGDVNIPLYWIRPQEILSGASGSHRFTWDQHYAPLDVPASYPISATNGQTTPDFTSPWALPGNYTVKLTVDGTSTSQPLKIVMDPRVKTSTADLVTQHDLSLTCYQNRIQLLVALEESGRLREQIKSALPNAKGDVAAQLGTTDQVLAKMESSSRGIAPPNLGRLSGIFGSLLNIFQETEMPATTQGKAGVTEAQGQFDKVMFEWKNWKEKDLVKLNKQLKQAGLKELK